MGMQSLISKTGETGGGGGGGGAGGGVNLAVPGSVV